MTPYNTDDIRNIALVGQAGAGKTSLAEALLFKAGAITTLGSVEKGTATCDYDPEEQAYQHSLKSAIVGFDYNGSHINLFDTPGDPDFIGPTLSTAPAADAIALVINAQNGIEAMSRRLMEWAHEHHYVRMIIVNKIDGEERHLPQVLEQIRTTFGKECLPINLPAKNGKGIVDCFFQDRGEAQFLSVEEIHTALMDQVVEMDEELMANYLEQGSIEPERLHDTFERALREGHLIPVCFTSARSGVGVEELLEVFARLMPNPREGTEHVFVDDGSGQGTSVTPVPEADKPVLAHVFKVTYDPFVGKMGLFRIHQGTITKDTQLFVDNQRKPFKVSHLFRVQGKEHHEADIGIPGDICAVAKVDELHIGAILHDSHDADNIHPPVLDVPRPTAGVAIEPKSRGDEQKISEALQKLVAEDPCLEVERNSSTHETIVRGLGDLHLRITMEKIKQRYNIDVDTHTPSIAYRETITAPAEGHHRHKKQSGGAGQFGEVFLRIEPLARNGGFEFVNNIVGGSIPGQFVPAVEKGVRQALERGVLAGYPIQDVRVSVYDGKFHAVDSNEVSFVTAARKAFVDAFNKARPIVLEPIVNIEVTTPHANMGDISGDLAARRGRILDTQADNSGRIRIVAQVPMAELTDYQSRLKSLTGGEGMYRMELGAYEQVPGDVQQRLAREYKPQEAD